MSAVRRWRLSTPEVHRLIHAQQAMAENWGETEPHSPERAALWTELHRAGDAAADLVYGGPSLSVRWRYWIRPFDDVADRRRWKWQPAQRCGLGGLSRDTADALVRAVDWGQEKDRPATQPGGPAPAHDLTVEPAPTDGSLPVTRPVGPT